MLSKYKNITNEKETLIKDLAEKLNYETKEQKEKLKAIQEEVRVIGTILKKHGSQISIV